MGRHSDFRRIVVRDRSRHGMTRCQQCVTNVVVCLVAVGVLAAAGWVSPGPPPDPLVRAREPVVPMPVLRVPGGSLVAPLLVRPVQPAVVLDGRVAEVAVSTAMVEPVLSSGRVDKPKPARSAKPAAEPRPVRVPHPKPTPAPPPAPPPSDSGGSGGSTDGGSSGGSTGGSGGGSSRPHPLRDAVKKAVKVAVDKATSKHAKHAEHSKNGHSDG